MVYWQCRQYPVRDAAEEAIAVLGCPILQNIWSWRLLYNDSLMLPGGGPGVVFQIDESLFSHINIKTVIKLYIRLSTNCPFIGLTSCLKTSEQLRWTTHEPEVSVRDG